MPTVVRPHPDPAIERLLSFLDGVHLASAAADPQHLPQLELAWGPAIKTFLRLHMPDRYALLDTTYGRKPGIQFVQRPFATFDRDAMAQVILELQE